MPARFAVSDAARDVLRRSTVEFDKTTPPLWSLRLPAETLDRKIYLDVNKVLEGAGGKWNRSLRVHSFPSDPRKILGLAVEEGIGRNVKTERQAFYSPPVVARRVVELAEMGEDSFPNGLDVLEPSAGQGALVRAVFEENPRCRLDAYENDPATRDALEALEKEITNAGIGSFWFSTEADFLSEPVSMAHGQYDRVLMNPPWAKGQDVAHVLHALRFLKPGGVLVAVMPASADLTTWAASIPIAPLKKGQRPWAVAWEEHDADWFPLPDGSFRESGTDVRSGIVRLRRTP